MESWQKHPKQKRPPDHSVGLTEERQQLLTVTPWICTCLGGDAIVWPWPVGETPPDCEVCGAPRVRLHEAMRKR